MISAATVRGGAIVENDDIFAECYFRVTKEEVPKELKGRMPKCLRAEGCFCNLDGLVKKKKKECADNAE